MSPNRKRGNVEKQSSMNRNSPKMLSDPAPSGWPSKNFCSKLQQAKSLHEQKRFRLYIQTKVAI